MGDACAALTGFMQQKQNPETSQTCLEPTKALEVLDVQAPGLSHCSCQDSAIITCCLLQMAAGQCVQPIQARGGISPRAPVSSHD